MNFAKTKWVKQGKTEDLVTNTAGLLGPSQAKTVMLNSPWSKSSISTVTFPAHDAKQVGALDGKYDAFRFGKDYVEGQYAQKFYCGMVCYSIKMPDEAQTGTIANITAATVRLFADRWIGVTGAWLAVDFSANSTPSLSFTEVQALTRKTQKFTSQAASNDASDANVIVNMTFTAPVACTAYMHLYLWLGEYEVMRGAWYEGSAAIDISTFGITFDRTVTEDTTTSDVSVSVPSTQCNVRTAIANSGTTTIYTTLEATDIDNAVVIFKYVSTSDLNTVMFASNLQSRIGQKHDSSATVGFWGGHIGFNTDSAGTAYTAPCGLKCTVASVLNGSNRVVGYASIPVIRFIHFSDESYKLLKNVRVVFPSNQTLATCVIRLSAYFIPYSSVQNTYSYRVENAINVLRLKSSFWTGLGFSQDGVYQLGSKEITGTVTAGVPVDIPITSSVVPQITADGYIILTASFSYYDGSSSGIGTAGVGFPASNYDYPGGNNKAITGYGTSTTGLWTNTMTGNPIPTITLIG